MTAEITLFHAPKTRAFTALWLLEELGLDYTLEPVDLQAGEHRTAEFKARNPMGKVQTVSVGDVHVAETGAIAIYLADRFSPGDLAPAIDDPARADFLRWCFFAAAILEPAYGEKIFKWDVPSSSVAWGSFDRMIETVSGGIEANPWLTGDRFTVADVVVASGLRFGMMFGILEKTGPIDDYVARATARPAFERAAAIEADELAKWG